MIFINDDDLKISLTLTSVWKCKHTSEIMGEVESHKGFEMDYGFETYNKKLITKAFANMLRAFLISLGDIKIEFLNCVISE